MAMHLYDWSSLSILLVARILLLKFNNSSTIEIVFCIFILKMAHWCTHGAKRGIIIRRVEMHVYYKKRTRKR